MKNNKYYTPTIEEFHIGFEYEELLNIWTFNTIDILAEFEGLDYDMLKLRVKYLDEIDLLSLGFIFDEYTSKQYSIINKDGDTYSIDFDCLEKTNSVRDGIGIIIYNDTPEQLFIGYIKNKSELKLLLSQLNIL